MSSSRNLREPNSVPLALNVVPSSAPEQQRMGRGRGILCMGSGNRPTPPGQMSQNTAAVTCQGDYTEYEVN